MSDEDREEIFFLQANDLFFDPDIKNVG